MKTVSGIRLIRRKNYDKLKEEMAGGYEIQVAFTAQLPYNKCSKLIN
jgi:hypothetical protein